MNEAVDALLDGPGVLLGGSMGSGRKTMASAIVRRLQGESLVIDLGFPEQQRVSLAFKKILDGLEFQDEAARLQAIATTHAMLQEEASGLPVIVYVPESLVLGRRSTSFLSALALSNTVKLLCLSTMLPGTEHQELDDLLGSVHLHSIRLFPLTLEETRQKLSAALDGEISRVAAYQIWTATAGLIHMIVAVAQDWVDLGYLVKSRNIWVVIGQQVPTGPRSRAIWAQLVSRTQGKERDVIELLALSKEMPLSVMMGVCDPDAVDAVYAKGLVEIGGDYPRSIRLGKALNDVVVCDQISPGKARELLDRYLGVGDKAPRMKALIRLGWEQTAGMEPDHQLVLEAAFAALSQRQIERCLRVLDGHQSTGPESELLRLEAMVCGGYFEHAFELLGALRARFGAEIPAPSSAQSLEELLYMIRLNTAAARIHAVQQDPNSTHSYAEFASVRSSIAEWKSSSLIGGTALDVIAGQLDLAEMEMLYHLGWPLWAEDLPYTHPQLESEDQRRWQFLHNLHSVRRGQIRRAIKRGSELLLINFPDSFPAGKRGNFRQHFADLYLVAGEWDKALGLIEAAWIGGEESSRITEQSGLYSSLIYVFTRRNREALAQLRIEIEQLKASDPDDQLPLATAAAALAASRIDVALAEEFLANLAQMTADSSWDTKQGVIALRGVAEFNLGRQQVAVDLLINSAGENAARGALNLELTSRLMLLRLGHQGSTDQLRACAEKIDGSLASRMTLLLNGPEQNFEYEHGQAPMNDWVYDHSLHVKLSDTPGLGQAAAFASEESRSVSGHVDISVTPETNSSASAIIMTLTKRQRTIVAEAVTGASSRDISNRLRIGVRTVEGHLYQIYQKLHVTSRQELSALYRNEIEANGETWGEDR